MQYILINKMLEKKVFFLIIKFVFLYLICI